MSAPSRVVRVQATPPESLAGALWPEQLALDNDAAMEEASIDPARVRAEEQVSCEASR